MWLRILFTIIFCGTAFLLIWYFLMQVERRKVRNRLGQLVKKMEETYTHFFKKRVTLSLLESKDPEKELPPIMEEALEVLTADYLALRNYVDEVEMSGITFPTPSILFQQLQVQLEVILSRKNQRARARLSSDDKKALDTILQACIQGDLRVKLIELRSSDLV